jgi:hypothetical protein
LSFSGGSGRSFSGKKGFSPSQKKDKKKKQEFRKRIAKFTPEEHLDFAQLKDRVTIALNRLGNQVFSLEPGGYDFGHWMSSFDLLLDDFEEKAPAENLPKEYFEAREKLTADLSSPVDTSAVDSDIHTTEEAIKLIQEKISTINRRAVEQRNRDRVDSASKMEELKKERSESDKEMGRAKSTLEEQKKVEAKQSVFGKLFSRSSATSAKATQNKIDSIAARKTRIDEELENLAAERAKKQSSKVGSGNEIPSLEAELESQQQTLGELETEKQNKLQLAEKRKEVTKTLSEIIAKVQLQTGPITESDKPNGSDFAPLN